MELWQGDCLELMKRIPDGSVDMVLTDPPYGTTDNKWDMVIPTQPMWKELNRVVKENGAVCLFSQQPYSTDLILSNRKQFRYEWIWEKSNPVGFLNANKMPLRAHENIMVFYKKLPTYHPQMTKGKPYVSKAGNRFTSNYRPFQGVETRNQGFRYPRDVIKYPGERGLHPTQKPVPLLEYMVKTYTDPGETVLDFTMGSGSTGVACANTGRNFVGIEKDPQYFATAQQRICRSLEN